MFPREVRLGHKNVKWVPTWGRSSWAGSWQLTRSKARLECAKTSVQPHFESQDPPWPSSLRMPPDQYFPQSCFLFPNPPWPSSLRMPPDQYFPRSCFLFPNPPWPSLLRSKYIKGSKQCYLSGQNTTCIFLGSSPLSSNKMTLNS